MANNTPSNFFDNTSDIVDMYVTKEYIINNYANILLFVKTPQLWCWGTSNTFNNAQYTTPIVHPTYSTGWQQLSGANSGILGIKGDGSMYAWGTAYSQFLTPSSSTSYTTPYKLGSKSDWIKVATSTSISCGIDSSGTLYSWGTSSMYIGRSGNADSQLSITTTNKIINVSAGINSYAFIDEYYNLYTVGNNSYGQIGNGTTNTASTPYFVTNSDNASWLSVSCGYYYTFAIDSNHVLWGWGNNQNGVIGTLLASFVLNPVKIYPTVYFKKVCTSNYNGSGNSFIGAIDVDGRLWMWGDNTYGQLGNGGTTTITAPTLVNHDTNWCSVYCHDARTVAIKTDGTLWGWGKNTYGQAGVGSTEGKILTPTRLGTETTWKDICLLSKATLGLLESGGW